MRGERKHIQCLVVVDGSVRASPSEEEKEREGNAKDSVSLCKYMKKVVKNKSDDINITVA